MAMAVVSLIVASNTHIGELVTRTLGFFRRETLVPAQEIKVNDPTAEFKVNDNSGPANALPVRGQLELGKKPAGPSEPQEALTANTDESWQAPSLDLLSGASTKADAGDVKANAAIIQHTLESFGIGVTMGEVNVGPTVTQYTFTPPSGVKLNKITTLDTNLALSLAAHPIRIEAPIPGKSAVG